MFDCWTSVGLIAASLLLLYLYLVRNNNHWAKRGIPYVKPTPLLGSFGESLFAKRAFVEIFNERYSQLKKHGFGGLFEMTKPTFIVTDPELIRDITVKSFDYFHDRRESVASQEADPLFSRSLPLLKGDSWRQMRTKLSPAFTASKLKGMFPHISKCASKFSEFLVARKDAKTEPIEFKSAFARLTNNMIASSAFGMETNAVQNPDEQFFKFAQKIANFDVVRTLTIMVFPKLTAKLGISFTPKKVTDFFMKIIKGTMQLREKENISRPDMLQLLMAAQKGKLKSEVGEEVGTIGEDAADSELHKKHMAAKKGDSNNISDEDITAQAFLFFFAGFDTVATVLSFLAYELAVNPEIQERLRDEIDSTYKDGKLTYESVMGLKYVDMVVSEVLRKYPPNISTDRTCTKNYKIPGTDKFIEAGTTLYIPIYPLQRDPDHFPEPDKFDPERFSEENKANIKPYTYLPFGGGPHNCIGMRLALIEVKLCVIYLLASCNLQVSAKTDVPLKFAKTIVLASENGVWLNATPRKNPTIIK